MRMSLMLPVTAALAAVIGISSPASADTKLKDVLAACNKRGDCQVNATPGKGVNIKVGHNEIWCPFGGGSCSCVACGPKPGRTQTDTGVKVGGGVLTQSSPNQGADSTGSWTKVGDIFASQSNDTVSKKKPHSQPTPTPTAEPKSTPPAPTPTPTAEPKSPPATPTRNARDHRTTPRIGDDRSSPGVTKTRYDYEGAVKASRPGPSEARKPKIRDHRAQPNVRDHQGVDPATRSGPSEARKPNIRDHRAGAQSAGASPSVPPRTAGSGGRVCGISGTPPCQQQ